MIQSTRSNKRFWLLLVIALVLITTLSACYKKEDKDDKKGELVIKDAWVRATIPIGDTEGADSGMGRVSGAFMMIENSTDQAERLIRVEIPTEIASVVEIHETTMMGDVMQMRPVEGIDVPAGGSAELKPGSFHVMLLGVQKDLNPGDTVSLTLVFESGKTLTVDAAVKAME
ncbi:MAG: copper chaperone PCu(A)C [Chloroflexi bacterium]|nr:copper chaperone PCu(A)C [Chloroflexota bacterium]